MAATILFVLFVPLVLCATFPLPISQKVKSVQTDSARDVELSRRTLVFGLQEMLRRDENVEQVGTSHRALEDASGNRTKREIIAQDSCAEGEVWLKYRCVTHEMFIKLTEDNEDIQSPENIFAFHELTTEQTNIFYEKGVAGYYDSKENQNCAQGMVWLTYRCVTIEMYKRLTGNYERTSVQPHRGARPPLRVASSRGVAWRRCCRPARRRGVVPCRRHCKPSRRHEIAQCCRHRPGRVRDVVSCRHHRKMRRHKLLRCLRRHQQRRRPAPRRLSANFMKMIRTNDL